MMGKNQFKIKSWSFLTEYGYCLLMSTLFLLICTKSSPLYPFNDWVDANIFFTMGKGMMNGKVLYRDLFDHKGPYLYLIYGIGYLIGNKSFIGIYILEVISFSVFLFFSLKILTLFSDKRYSKISLILLAFFEGNIISFAHGGSLEELSLPLLTISLYYLLKYISSPLQHPFPNNWMFINGIIAGFVFWMKFSLLGFWLGWIASILIIYIFTRQHSKIFLSLSLFLGGMIIATIPLTLYFGVTHSISDLLNSYFLFNMNSYAQEMLFLTRFKFVAKILQKEFMMNPFLHGVVGLGFLIYILKNNYKNNVFNKVSVILCSSFLVFSVYGGGQFQHYYSLILTPFSLFSLIAIQKVYFLHFGRIKSKTILAIFIIILFIITLFVSIMANHNVYMLKIKSDHMVQFRYAEIINQTEDAALLNYGWLDCGLYTTTGIVPTMKYFFQPNIDYSKYPVIRDEQERYISEGGVDFIIVPIRLENYQGNEVNERLFTNYDLIMDDIQKYEGFDYMYLLFKKRD